jgi:hypothetical protein
MDGLFKMIIANLDTRCSTFVASIKKLSSMDVDRRRNMRMMNEHNLMCHRVRMQPQAAAH